MEIKVKNLRRHFPGTKAVDGISFSFHSGHIYGFVGPNGAGKTTTMRVISTLDEPTMGDVTIDGVSVVDYPERARRMVGFMPDSLPAHGDITIREYIDFFARSYGLKGKERTSRVEAVEEFTNLTKINWKYLKDLSKGLKQRVSLARAIIHDPTVLVLDEPAAGLDPRARIELRELLTILAGQGKAILISSHILTELSEICDGAVIIEQGKLLRAGHLSEIMHGESPHRRIMIRCDGPAEAIHRELVQTPLVMESQVVGPGVEVTVNGGDEVCYELLKFLMDRQLRVVEFHQHQADLEEVFMTVTKGQVQ